MKRQVYRHLLVIVSVILLIGLVASCKSDDPEPQFKVIESKAFTAYSDTNLTNQLSDWRNQKSGGKQALSNPDVIWNQYKNDINKLISDEMNKKNPAYGLLLVVKVDSYKLIGACRWTNKPSWSTRYSMYNY